MAESSQKGVHGYNQFKVLFFAGDRAADLLQVVTPKILRFPDDSGFLFNHFLTKSSKSEYANVSAFKLGSNKPVFPVLV